MLRSTSSRSHLVLNKLISEDKNNIAGNVFEITLINHLTDKVIARSEQFNLNSVINENNNNSREEEIKDFSIKLNNLVLPGPNNLEAETYSK